MQPTHLMSATSVDPAPMSYKTTCSVLLEKSRSMPYCRAAAVWELIRPMTLRPARLAASIRACRCARPKKAGTAMTRSLTGRFSLCASAICLMYWKMLPCVGSEVEEVGGGRGAREGELHGGRACMH